MDLKYLRISLFYKLLKPFSGKQRKQRMALFLDFVTQCGVQNPKVLDLGGQPEIWESVSSPLQITILNLPGIVVIGKSSVHDITYVEGDACNVRQYADNSFDIVFSNSVIEHVGDESNQQKFANEVHRLAKSYWIQTPSKYFPIEAHCGMPFWWYWPKFIRILVLKNWRKKLPAWTEMVEGTTVLAKSRMAHLFPLANIKTERFSGVPKSYIASFTPRK